MKRISIFLFMLALPCAVLSQDTTSTGISMLSLLNRGINGREVRNRLASVDSLSQRFSIINLFAPFRVDFMLHSPPRVFDLQPLQAGVTSNGQTITALHFIVPDNDSLINKLTEEFGPPHDTFSFALSGNNDDDTNVYKWALPSYNISCLYTKSLLPGSTVQDMKYSSAYFLLTFSVVPLEKCFVIPVEK